MVIEFDKRFLLDIKSIRDKQVRERIIKVIQHIKKAEAVSSIDNLKKLEKFSVHYRIKIKLDSKRDYRIGMIIRGNKVWLIRCLSRPKIYKQFP